MLRGAFIGFGHVARLGHLPGWLAREDVAIVAAADVRPEGRAALAQRVPGVRWYDSADAMLEGERLDFVDVCTPPAFHGAGIRAALERGLHVLCEKPLVLSPEELEDLAALARGRSLALTTVHNWRHAPALRRLTALVGEGSIGAICRCRWETLRDRPAVAAGTEADGNWRVDPAVAGGGILVDHGWHAFSTIQSWLPGDPERIGARLETRRHLQWPIEDTATVVLEFPRARAEVFLTWTAAERANRVAIEGSEASLLLDGATLELRSREGAVMTREELPRSLADGSHHPDWFAATAQEFLEEIREPSRRGRSLEEAARCLRWIEMARESSRRAGQPLEHGGVAPASTSGASQ